MASPKRRARSKHKSRLLVTGAAAFLIIVGIIVPLLDRHIASAPSPPLKSAPTTKHNKPSLKLPADFTLRDKIGQLMMVGVTSRQMAVDLERDYQIGGFLLRPGSDLFSKSSTQAIKKAGRLPPFLAIDEEGGQISRLPGADFSKYSARYMGSLPDLQVRQLGYSMGKAMADIGVNLNFAPVVDLDDGNNAAISALERSFSDNPQVVAKKAAAFAEGLRQAHIIPTFKHFPGLGNATGNTDDGPATSPSLSFLRRHDLVPYESLLKSPGPSAVMVGNQIVPGLTGGRPASLASGTYSLLRSSYGFRQVAFTDELFMAKAITEFEPTASGAIIDAIKSGADMPLFDPPDERTVGIVIDAVADAVNSGQIKESQIDASLARIMRLKPDLPK